MTQYYTVVFDGTRARCDHQHRTWDAAAACAEHTVRAAQRAVAGKRPRFDGDEFIAKHYSWDDPLTSPDAAVRREVTLG
jgi:hypothetical protein